ncbi:MAG: RNA-binding transcriptional accessory protein [Candidatus Omnitrophica bacterium]|nr:RNA-binding transcriptional accessory protein [Candidatus Omnitrophota bacterium]
MIDQYVDKISGELNIVPKKIQATIELLDGGSTVPFIARYRKEVTGSLDESAITNIRDRLHQLRELDKRRAAILSSLEERGKLTDELKEKILAAETLAVLEDIYLPYRPKRRTRATVAKEKGLEPLAELIFKQELKDLEQEAAKYINEELKVASVEEALAGARDIIAEWVSEDGDARAKMRELYFDKGEFRAKVIKKREVEGANYKDYFDWQEPVKTCPSHRVLAVRRAEKEQFVTLRVVVPEDEAIQILEKMFVKGSGPASEQVRLAVQDGFKRLLSLSMETEVRVASKETADKDAILVFADNLRQLLMAPPLGYRNVMAVDPAYRTGCKIACLNHEGKMVRKETIFPLGSDLQREEAVRLVRDLCDMHHIEFIAIGNGTASRETEDFIRSIGLSQEIHVLIVSEAGASIYSASEVAREEFPDLDVTIRGAISIGRRLMDPLAELVKIDPKSIGVGQYQHDVDQAMLKQSLDDVVVSCVNQVGVELNSASKQLLTYVSGLGPVRAQAIVEYREQNGLFRSREQLYDVPRLGPKAIEQAAGFLRIRDGINPLDASAVHPESYSVVDAMARDLGVRVQELIRGEELRKRIQLSKYVSDTVGMPTLEDIYEELAKPGRDPRQQFEVFRFKEGVQKPEDLTPGMKLPGMVTNITSFGVFVDIGVHLDGLVHVSQLSDKFIKDPRDFVKVHQTVEVTVMQVDLERKRIALTMKNSPDAFFGQPKKKSEKAKDKAKEKAKPNSPGPQKGGPKAKAA